MDVHYLVYDAQFDRWSSVHLFAGYSPPQEGCGQAWLREQDIQKPFAPYKRAGTAIKTQIDGIKAYCT